MLSIETQALSHRYPHSEAGLHDIGLQVPEGAIYGFLGPNGAGKSTLLRILLGLIRAQRGRVSIFGQPFDAHRIAILRRVGVLIETPSLYDHLAAAENLALLREIHRVPRAWIDDTLRLVGLGDTGSKKVAQFSLGMKQRLGIAAAMLHRPALLILDEPTNGLDPNGTIEMRALLKRLHDERGTTILVSSHVLAEIEKLVTHVGILVAGRLRFQGSLDVLRRSRESSTIVALRTDDDERALHVLAADVPAARRHAGGIALPALPPERVAAINRRLVECGIGVHALGTRERDLEAIFMEFVA